MSVSSIAAAAAAQPHKVEATPMVPGLTLHIDGDFLAYNTAGNDETLPGQARLNCLGTIEIFRAKVGAEHVVVHTTAMGSHKGERYLVATVKPYQGQRTSGRKPKNQPYLLEFLQSYTGDVFRNKIWATREADDGIAACSHFAVGKSPGYAAIATKDKDMRMLPGLHLDWDSLDVTRVYPGDYDVVGNNGKQYGLKFFWLQMLMGDTADNCPGLEQYLVGPGRYAKCGEKTAEKLLAGFTYSDKAGAAVIEHYANAYADDWGDRFVEQAALMWMRVGNDAPIDDFLIHAGHSKLSGCLVPEITAATARMKERVTLARQSLDALQHQGSA